MKPFQVLATNRLFHHDFLEKTQCLPLYRYDANGNRLDNITDWGLAQFQGHYNPRLKSGVGEQPFNHQRGHFPLYLRRSASPGLPPEIRTEPETGVSASAVLWQRQPGGVFR